MDAIEAAEKRGDIGKTKARLLDAMKDTPYHSTTEEALHHGHGLLEKLDNAQSQKLAPCPRCHCRELLVSGEAHIDQLYIKNGGTQFDFTIAVCSACGDVRFTAYNVAKLASLMTATSQKAFRSVTADE